MSATMPLLHCASALPRMHRSALHSMPGRGKHSEVHTPKTACILTHILETRWLCNSSLLLLTTFASMSTATSTTFTATVRRTLHHPVQLSYLGRSDATSTATRTPLEYTLYAAQSLPLCFSSKGPNSARSPVHRVPLTASTQQSAGKHVQVL